MILEISFAIGAIALIVYFGATAPIKFEEPKELHLNNLNLEALGSADNLEAFGLTEADLQRIGYKK